MKKDDDYLKNLRNGREKIRRMLTGCDFPSCIKGSLYQVLANFDKQIEGYINSTKTKQEGEK